MSINATPVTTGTIPYPNVEKNEIMHDYIFDDNNAALLGKINELVAKINNVVNALISVEDGDSGANNIKATAIPGLTGGTVQTLLEAIHAEIIEVVVGALPDASVTAAKLAADVLTLLDTTISSAITALMASQAEAEAGINNTKIMTPLSTRQGLINTASYLIFCTTSTPDALDAAFGKNNDDVIIGIGKQLAMYAWFKGADKTSHPFTNLLTKGTLDECLEDPASLFEIYNVNEDIINRIKTSPYAFAKLKAILNVSASVSDVICEGLSLDKTTYPSMTEIAESATAMGFVATSYGALRLVADSTPAMTALYGNRVIAERVLVGNAMANAVFLSRASMGYVGGTAQTLSASPAYILGGKLSDSGTGLNITTYITAPNSRTFYTKSLVYDSGFAATVVADTDHANRHGIAYFVTVNRG